jgi:hypothetical protein
MKMLKNLFASLLFAVLTFTASAQVTHTIPVALAGSTVNVTATVGDILHFVTAGAPLNTLMILRKTPGVSAPIASFPSISTDYTIQENDTAYYVTNGGAGTTYGKITIPTSTLTAGIESLKHTTSKLSVFPNPSTDEVSVTFNTNKEKTPIEVFDIEGRLVMTDETTREIGQNTTKINISNFSQGLYIIRAGTERIRIIKE